MIGYVIRLSRLKLVQVALLWFYQEWFPDLLSLPVAKSLPLPQVWNLLMQPHVHRFLNNINIHGW